MTGLLEGVRVVEAAMLLVGDYVGSLLGDEGADVIKVEMPGGGDYIRDILGALAPHCSPAHVAVNRSKRSVALDLRRPGAQEVLHRLVAGADVFVTGYAGEVLTRLGMDEPTLRTIKPDLVYCQATGFGAEGPYAAIPTHSLMMNSLGRAPELSVDDDGAVQVGTLSPDAPGVVAGPLFAAFGVAAALYRRDRTGEGAYLDVSCTDAVIASSHYGVAALNRRHLVEDGDAPVFPEGAPVGGPFLDYYLTSDDRVLFFCCIEPKFWASFCAGVDRADLVARHNGRQIDFGDDPALGAELRAVFRTRTLDEWMDLFVARSLPAAPALGVEDAPADPHLAARGIFVAEDHPAVGPLTVPGSPIRLPGRAFAVDRHAPAVGEQTNEVLAELGPTTTDIDALRAEGATG